MKQLFGTSDLEAEVFDSEELLKDEISQTDDYSEETADEFDDLEELAEFKMENLPALELSLELEDGRTEVYEVATVFACGEKEYIGLFPKSDTDGTLCVMQLMQGEDDEIELLPVEEEEWQAVHDRFLELYAGENFESGNES